VWIGGVLLGKCLEERDERCEIELDIKPGGQGMLILFWEVQGEMDKGW
jgi:hypothetical protein